MSNNKKLSRRIGTDIAGVACLLLIPLIGPLPGPGGIPLLITGLGLLSLNHSWAKKWLNIAKNDSESLQKIAFPDIRLIKNLWDMFAFSLMFGGIWISFSSGIWILRALAIILMASSTTIFFINRSRSQKITAFLTRKKSN